MNALAERAEEQVSVAEEPIRAPAAPNKLRFVILATLAIGLGGLIAKFAVDAVVEERRAATLEQVEQRLLAQARGKAEVLETWIDGLSEVGNRLLRSDLVRLFVTEFTLAESEPALEQALAAQKPYMRQVLDELAAQHDLAGVHLTTTTGRSIASDREATPLRDDRVGEINSLLATDSLRLVSTSNNGSNRVVMDIYQPIRPAQTVAEDETGAVGVLVMTVDVTAEIARILAPNPTLNPGENVGLWTRRPRWLDGAAS